MSLCAEFYYCDKQGNKHTIQDCFNSWFMYRHFENLYKDTQFVNESTIECPVSYLQVLELHQQACKKLYDEHLDLNLTENDETIYSKDVQNLKKVIHFMKDNPTTFVFYQGGY